MTQFSQDSLFSHEQGGEIQLLPTIDTLKYHVQLLSGKAFFLSPMHACKGGMQGNKTSVVSPPDPIMLPYSWLRLCTDLQIF